MALFTENTVNKLVLPENSCLMNYSVLNDYYSATPFRSFSIKYVIEGIEHYGINGTRYEVRNREYILANRHSEGYVEVGSRQAVSGICIDVAPDILSEVVASLLRPDTAVSDRDLDRFFHSPDFLENKYAAGSTQLGRCLIALEQALLADPRRDPRPDRECYLLLAEKIIEDHIPVMKQLRAVKAVKTETRKDLFRKLESARRYMDRFFRNSPSIGQVAREAGFSEYHFFRLFRAVYALSPHQYMLRKRLKLAQELISREGLRISDAALMCGFSDVHSFSKSYRNFFGKSPSQHVGLK